MKIPPEILLELEKAAEGAKFAKIVLEILIHDSRPKFRIIRETSFIPGKKSSGAVVEGVY